MPAKTPWEATLTLLNASPKSEAMLAARLGRKGFSDSEIKDAINKAKQYKFIDDEAYAQRLVEREIVKGRGPERIRAKLIVYGVSETVIAKVFKNTGINQEKNWEDTCDE